MLRIDIITCLPHLLRSPLEHSLLRLAQEKGKLHVEIHALRDFSRDKHRKVDDYPYGGGSGMVLQIEPVDRCLEMLKKQRHYDDVIYLSPDGEPFTQQVANRYSLSENLVLVCGHYKGIDERIRMHLVSREISIGDYVLTGGELPALVLTDAIARLLPGVLNDEQSALDDSFQNDQIAPPTYTRPPNYKGWEVPKVLLSGDAKKVRCWREKESLKRTQARRPHLLGKDKT